MKKMLQFSACLSDSSRRILYTRSSAPPYVVVRPYSQDVRRGYPALIHSY
jgi:hypothetical protein